MCQAAAMRSPSAPRLAALAWPIALAILASSGCGKKKREASPPGELDAPAAAMTDGGAARDGGAAIADAAGLLAFPELAELPRIEAVREIALPVRFDVPRFEVHGPVIGGGVALVASSQLGFAAVDWKSGKLLWTRAAGAHVAPPLMMPNGDAILLGDCPRPPATDEPVAGCLQVVSPGGADRNAVAVLASAEAAAAMRGPGEQKTWRLDDQRVAWQRGEARLTVDLASGRASAGAPDAPPFIVRYQKQELAITLRDGELLAHSLDGERQIWKAPGRFTALLGTVPGQPYEAPMLRGVRAGTVRGVTPSGTPYFDVLDIDAMTAAGGQAAFPAPGIQLLGTSSSAGAAAALAIRLDRSLRRDYVIGYTASARIAWAYPLPVVMRTDPVGLAIADDAVLAFHDGDTITVLPPVE
jgi:hypothetical protein